MSQVHLVGEDGQGDVTYRCTEGHRWSQRLSSLQDDDWPSAEPVSVVREEEKQ